MSVFQFGVENLPPQVSEQWQIARPDKSRALEASKQAAQKAAVTVADGSWVGRALSGIGLLQDRDKEAKLRAAQAEAMLAGHAYLEQATAEANARAAAEAKVAAVAAAARAEAEAQAESLATEVAEEARLAIELRKASARALAAAVARTAPAQDMAAALSGAAAKLAAPAEAAASWTSDFEFGDFEGAAVVAPGLIANKPDTAEERPPAQQPLPAAPASPEPAPNEPAAAEERLQAQEPLPAELASLARLATPPAAAAGTPCDEAQEVADLKRISWSEDEADDGAEEPFKPAMKVVILAKQDSFEPEAGTLQSCSLFMPRPPKGVARPKTPARGEPTPVARRTRAGRRAASKPSPKPSPEVAEAGRKRGRKSGEAGEEGRSDEGARPATRQRRSSA